jgi:hypothetical protein
LAVFSAVVKFRFLNSEMAGERCELDIYAANGRNTYEEGNAPSFPWRAWDLSSVHVGS